MQIPSEVIINSNIVYDRLNCRILRDDEEVSVSFIPFKMLGFLIQNVGKSLSIEDIATGCWPKHKAQKVKQKSVVEHIKKIRHILGDNGKTKMIRAVHDHGYYFDAKIEYR